MIRCLKVIVIPPRSFELTILGEVEIAKNICKHDASVALPDNFFYFNDL
jgi:hypothetical protein